MYATAGMSEPIVRRSSGRSRCRDPARQPPTEPTTPTTAADTLILIGGRLHSESTHNHSDTMQGSIRPRRQWPNRRVLDHHRLARPSIADRSLGVTPPHSDIPRTRRAALRQCERAQTAGRSAQASDAKAPRPSWRRIREPKGRVPPLSLQMAEALAAWGRRQHTRKHDRHEHTSHGHL